MYHGHHQTKSTKGKAKEEVCDRILQGFIAVRGGGGWPPKKNLWTIQALRRVKVGPFFFGPRKVFLGCAWFGCDQTMRTHKLSSKQLGHFCMGSVWSPRSRPEFYSTSTQCGPQIQARTIKSKTSGSSTCRGCLIRGRKIITNRRHTGTSVPNMAIKHGGGEEKEWKVCVDFTNLNLVCPKDPFSVTKNWPFSRCNYLT